MGTLRSLDGKSYQKYAELPQFVDLDGMTLYFDRIQSEPASSSLMRLRISFAKAGFPGDTHDTGTKEVALRDLIARRFWESCRMFAKGGGSGGMISIPRPGQEILERSCVVMSPTFIEVRFRAALPSEGRNIAAGPAAKMFTADLAEIAKASLFFSSYKQSKLYNHLNTAVTAQTIRSSLRERGLVSFIADGSVLPRREDGLAPMIDAIPFSSPDELRVSFVAADGSMVKGMGVPEGLTAVIGATRHGKTVLTEALAAGVYDHIPGDGRELVITVDDAVMITKDTGRSIRNVDVSMFMSDRENDVRSLTADDADDAVSSAVSAAEAVELGCRTLIADDTAVHRGLIHSDDKLEKMVPEGSETMIPFSKSIRGSRISAVAVCGHSGLADAADTVIVMHRYTASGAVVRKRAPVSDIPLPADRRPIAKNVSTAKGRKETNSVAVSASKIEFGERTIKIPVPMPDICQTSAAAHALIPAKEMMDGSVVLREIAERIAAEYRRKISSADTNIGDDKAAFRSFDIADMINRHPDIVFAKKT